MSKKMVQADSNAVKSMWFRRLLEFAAVTFNLLFTLLYLNESMWAFPMGIVGPLILLILCFRERLYAEPLLQVVYVISAIIGWYNTQSGWASLELSLSIHIILLSLSTGAAIAWGFLLKRYTTANLPFPDALVASWGILATWLMMYQVHACWLYLIAINTVSIFIYAKRRLYLAAMMFVCYLIMAVDGYYQFGWFEF